jgi:hypothetical protein
MKSIACPAWHPRGASLRIGLCRTGIQPPANRFRRNAIRQTRRPHYAEAMARLLQLEDWAQGCDDDRDIPGRAVGLERRLGLLLRELGPTLRSQLAATHPGRN